MTMSGHYAMPVATFCSESKELEVSTVIRAFGAWLVVVGPVSVPLERHMIGYDAAEDGCRHLWIAESEKEASAIALAWAEGRRENGRH